MECHVVTSSDRGDLGLRGYFVHPGNQLRRVSWPPFTFLSVVALATGDWFTTRYAALLTKNSILPMCLEVPNPAVVTSHPPDVRS